jgi:hypothetical protein
VKVNKNYEFLIHIEVNFEKVIKIIKNPPLIIKEKESKNIKLNSMSRVKFQMNVESWKLSL